MFTSIKKNWRTTLLGAITGLVMIIKGIVLKNTIFVIEGVGIAITGALASDGVNTTLNTKDIETNKETIETLNK